MQTATLTLRMVTKPPITQIYLKFNTNINMDDSSHKSEAIFDFKDIFLPILRFNFANRVPLCRVKPSYKVPIH